MRISVLIVTAVLALCKVNGAEVNVYAAASLTDVMKEIGSAYEKESADKILFNLELRACSRDKSSNNASAQLEAEAEPVQTRPSARTRQYRIMVG